MRMNIITIKTSPPDVRHFLPLNPLQLAQVTMIHANSTVIYNFKRRFASFKTLHAL